MSILPRPSSPAAAWRDFKAFVGGKGRHKLLIALIALAMPALIVTAFYHDANIKPLPRLIYVEQWSDNRTDAEIIAQQKIDEKKRQADMKKRQREYQKVADMFGIDTKK